MYSKGDVELIQKYRRVFGTGEGREILHDILLDIGFFKDGGAKAIEDVRLKEFGKRLLFKCGIWNEENTERITEALLNIPFTTPKEATDDM